MCNFTAYIKFLVKPLKINFKRSFNFLFLKFCRNSHWWKALKIVGSGRIYDGGYFFLSIILQVSVGQQLTAQGLIAQHHILHLEWVKKARVSPGSALSDIYIGFIQCQLLVSKLNHVVSRLADGNIEQVIEKKQAQSSLIILIWYNISIIVPCVFVNIIIM